MSEKIYNIGEGLAIIGIMIGVGLTKNYWLLFFMFLPIWAWQKKSAEENNVYVRKFSNLELEKLTQEIRILKSKQKPIKQRGKKR